MDPIFEKEKNASGVEIRLTGDEVAHAIRSYLFSKKIYVTGPSTVSVNGQLCRDGRLYVDPSGSVIYEGHRYSGMGRRIK